MKKLFLITLLSLFLILPFMVGTSDATPGKSVCTGCHSLDAAVSVTATFTGCSGTDANYTVTVSDTYDAGEGWAVFDSGSNNLANSLGTSGTFSVPGGATYDVRGVSDSDQGIGGGKGGSNVTTISPDCGGPTCTDGDGDTYAVEGGTCGPVDCDDTDPNINPGAEEDCTDGIDNDCDGLTDAADPDAINCPPTCTDSDGDLYSVEGGTCGAADCNDNDAAVNPGAVEDCVDTIDNDCDDLLDCDDSDCIGDPACPTGEPEICDDGIDNDLDGKTDCSDKPDCRTDPACTGGGGDPEICDDGIDNDGDGKTDCSDRDCRNDPVCDSGGPGGDPEICTDGIDNDGDGKTDCADKKDCGKDPAC